MMTAVGVSTIAAVVFLFLWLTERCERLSEQRQREHWQARSMQLYDLIPDEYFEEKKQ